MDAMYQIEVFSATGPTGVTTWQMKGQRLFVDGQPMVRMPHGTIVQADGWFPTIREARLHAAFKLDSMARAIAAQASEMRECAEDPE